MATPNPDLPPPNSATLNPATFNTSEDNAANMSDAENSKRNADFDRRMSEYNKAENADLLNENLSTEDYLRNSQSREAQEYAELQRWKDDPTLSENQRAEVGARIKMLDYSNESRKIQDAYVANPNDENAKSRYDAREAELKEYRVLMQESKEFGHMPQMAEMRKLEGKLENAKTIEDKMAVKMEMAETMVEFKRELLKAPDGSKDKVLSFIESNKDNEVMKKTGMVAMAEVLRGREKEMGKEPDLENTQVKPAGAARAGGTDATDKNANDAAEKEVAATADDGKRGSIDPVRMEARDAADIQAPAGGPAQQKENAVGIQ